MPTDILLLVPILALIYFHLDVASRYKAWVAITKNIDNILLIVGVACVVVVLFYRSI